MYHQIRHLYLQQIVNNIVDYYGLLVTKKAMWMFLTSGSFFISKAARFTVQNNNNRTAIILSANTGSGVSNTQEPRRCCTVHVPPHSPRLKPPWINIVPLATQLNHLIKNSSIVWGETPSPSVRPSTFLLSDKLKCAPGGRPRVNTRNLFSHPISGLRGEPDRSKAEATMWVTWGHPASSQSPGW